MAHFPIFINLAGKKCALVGGGTVAVRKARMLLDFGALVYVSDPEPAAEMEELYVQGAITLRKRRYGGPDDLQGAVLAIAATDDAETNRRVSKDAKALGIPVNVVDVPELCTFYFPAVARRGELVAGISTSGGYPALAARLRDVLEEVWPDNLDSKLKVLAEARKQILHRIPDPALRRAILKDLMKEVLRARGADENSLRLLVQDFLNKM